MTTYSCETCKFTTPLKSNYTNHLETRKHIKNSAEVSQVKTYDCKFCDKKYSHKQSVTKHLKSCTKKEEIEEMISIQEMTSQIKIQTLELREQQNRIREQQNRMEVQTKRINELMHKLEILDSSNEPNNIEQVHSNETSSPLL
jgi:hypothetical protein